MLLYRGIFHKNTHKQVTDFFTDPVIRSLWPGILARFTEELYWEGNSGAAV